jgi:cytochrome c-type biogenesis protein CcmH
MISIRRCAVLLALLFALPAPAIDTTILPNAQLQARYEALTHELRCMQCQNNSIADSPVFLAADLRKQVAEQLIAGKTDDEIRDYMVQRYGDVILFKPPLNASTAWVWFAPLIALVGGVVVAVVIVRRRSKLVATDDSIVDGDERL